MAFHANAASLTHAKYCTARPFCGRVSLPVVFPQLRPIATAAAIRKKLIAGEEDEDILLDTSLVWPTNTTKAVQKVPPHAVRTA